MDTAFAYVAILTIDIAVAICYDKVMDFNVRDNEGDSQNTVERLFAIINQTGFPRHVRKCNIVAEDVKALLAGNSIPLSHKSRPWHRVFAEHVRDNTWKGQQYRKLNLTELLIYLEVTGTTTYSEYIFDYTTSEDICDILYSDKVTLGLKLLLSCDYSMYSYVAVWLLNADHGEHIQKYIELSNNDCLFRLARIAVLPLGDTVNSYLIHELKEGIVTCDVLRILLPLKDFKKGHHVVPALASHARRLYDFDESIPDEWVLNAIN